MSTACATSGYSVTPVKFRVLVRGRLIFIQVTHFIVHFTFQCSDFYTINFCLMRAFFVAYNLLLKRVALVLHIG